MQTKDVQINNLTQEQAQLAQQMWSAPSLEEVRRIGSSCPVHLRNMAQHLFLVMMMGGDDVQDVGQAQKILAQIAKK